MYAHRHSRTSDTALLAELARIVALAAGLWLIGAAALGAQEVPPDFEYDQAAPGAELNGTYGYVRTIEGSATLIQPDGERIQIQVNEPVLVGDRVFVSGDSRLEIVLADRNLLRLGQQADLGFTALANSADATDASTVLQLRRGTAQLIVVADQVAQQLPGIGTPNANIQIREVGSYLVVVDDDEYTEVVVREGRADVLTESDGAEVRPGESLFVEGGRNASFEFASAPGLDRLETWGDGQYAGGESAQYVDQDLSYSAATLNNNGTWVSVGAGWAWRPHVSVGWAPYRHGRWRWTPTGWFWVSWDPWGWVPHHYGWWNWHNSWGWLWNPGRRFASAHVYFVWGSGGWAGWAPTGYYSHHYGGYYGNRWGWHHGSYGYVRGSGWYSKNRYWTFLPTDRLGHRRQNVYALSGEEFGRRGRSLGRTVLTTDTRSLSPDVWRRPGEGVTRLARDASRQGRELGDATAFVNRVERLPSSIERVTLRDGGGAARTSGNASESAGGTLRSRGGVDVLRPDAERDDRGLNSRGLSNEARTRAGDPARTDVRSLPGRSGTDVGGLRRPDTVQPSTRSTARPEIDRGRSGGTLRRSGDVTRPQADGRATRSGELRRPETQGRASGSDQVQRPEARGRSTSSGQLRRPASPVGRTPTIDRSTSRPSARSGSSGARPTVRSGSSGGSRPTVRPSGSSRSSGASRSSGPSRSRGASRSSGSSRSSGASRSSGPSRSSGASRSSGSSRSSGASRSSGRSRSSGASRSSGSSRSSGASRSSGPSRSSGASRSSGSSRSSGASRSGSSRSSGASRPTRSGRSGRSGS